MLRVYLNKIVVTYRGCPEDGLAAIDWRRAHGLADAVTNRAGELDLYSVQSEKLCRLRPNRLDTDADLNVTGGRVALPIATANLLLALPESWQETDAPLTPEEQAALVEVIEALYPV